ncbi:hypothetical protein [Bacillus cereus]|uniref:hypothetical protein n=1 Tax=Bacillus cereus TaxID=1396 RepID=UPI000BF51085|nr:hypothetical protein [Bacillus cereus]PFA74325.1 hypothetical protein CN406_24800 [Bacillus cereus]
MRINNLLNKFGKPTTILRRKEKDPKNPYDKGSYKEIGEIIAIVDEGIQGTNDIYSSKKVFDQVDAVMYSAATDLRSGDKIRQRDKEFNVMKVANPYSSDDHIETILESVK